MDATIAHLAFAWQAPFVKFGIAGKERLAKLNELIKIEKAAA
jgi:enolase